MLTIDSSNKYFVKLKTATDVVGVFTEHVAGYSVSGDTARIHVMGGDPITLTNLSDKDIKLFIEEFFE